MSADISVLIVNYNAGPRLARCLDCLEQQSVQGFEVIIFDNASSDHSLEEAYKSALDITIIPHDTNIGFAAANNRAAAVATRGWLLTLNPDAYAAPDLLEAFLAGIQAYPGTGAFGSRQINALDTTVLDGAGDAYFAFGLPYRGHFGWPVETSPGSGACFAPCAAAALYNAEVFRRLGGFDARFFCYGEDVDLGYRLRLEGGGAVQLDEAVVYHEGSAISGRRSDFTLYHGHRNRIWLAYKNTPFWLYWPLLPGHFLVNFALWGRCLLSGEAGVFIRALKDGYGGLWVLRKTRREALKNRKVSYAALIKIMTWSPLKTIRREAVIKKVVKS